MPDYSQADQPIRAFTDLDEDVLLPEGFSGEEGLSTPFHFTVDLVSENPEIDGEALLRTDLRLELDLPEGGVRQIHGIVNRFVQRGRERELISYRAEVVPWLWFLSLQQDSRIFQEMTVLEIVEEVFSGQGYSDFELRCTRSYEPREFTVQYRESNLAFVSRLMEDEGIFYFFEHSESKHMLVLADDMSAIETCEGQPEARMHSGATPDEDVVVALEREHVVHAGVATRGDYDYLKPSLTLRSTVSGNEPEEIYDHPTGFDEPDGGDRLARLALEREEARRHMIHGHGTCRAFSAGTRFDLIDHYRHDADQTYALVEVRHQARNASYRGSRAGTGTDYRCDFVAMPHSVPYRPPLRTRKPSVHGAQTAEVVGPSGEKIWVDKHSRVKVQFHWDRLGSQDEKSSCWVRVSQNWAGKTWGGMFIPHVGQEVIVDFLEGDPDRPIIVGRVYNAEHMPPQELPANKDKSIIEDDFGNEMVFDATPGEEHIRIHSPSHMSTLELGRSILTKTLSDLEERIKGHGMRLHGGFQFGGTIGAHATVDMGARFSAFLGAKVDVEVSQKAQVTFGSSVVYNRGREFRVGSQNFTQHVDQNILIDSDTEILMIGGGKDDSVLVGNSQELVVQFGANDNPKTAKDYLRPQWPRLAGLVTGISAAMINAAEWELTDDEVKGHYKLGAGVAIQAMLQAGSEVWQIFKDKKAPKISYDSLHDEVFAKLRLSEGGAALGAYNGTSKNPVSGIVFGGTGEEYEGKAVIKADEQVWIKSQKVVIAGESGILLKTPKVLATKGTFKTKNFEDKGG